MDTLTIEEFKSALPISLKKSVNPALLTQINEKLADPDMYDTYRENLLGYVHVMKEGKFKLSNYIDAVKYVSFKRDRRYGWQGIPKGIAHHARHSFRCISA